MTNKKIAVFLIGEPRTLYKTIHYLKNIIIKNENFHIFAVLQKNEHYLGNEILLNNVFDINLKSLYWFEKNDFEWNYIQDKLISDLFELAQNWKNYLKNSGSMIEYYQMYLAFNNMEKYEKENNIEYDYIFKIRSDNIITNSINFDWIDFDFEYIKNYIYFIKDMFNFESIINYKLISYFMNTIYYHERLKYIKYCRINSDWTKDYMLTDDLKKLLIIKDENEFLIKFYKYFKDEKYCFIFRSNNIYFMNRKNFQQMPILGITYGKYRYPDIEDHYWFNAESQFVKCLRYYNLDIFDSYSILEDKSLYEYNNSNYFDENNKLKTNLSDVLFFICRS